MKLTLYLGSLSDKDKPPWLGAPDADGNQWAAVYDPTHLQAVQALLPDDIHITEVVFMGMCQNCTNQLALELSCKNRQVWTEEAKALWSKLLLSGLRAVKGAA